MRENLAGGVRDYINWRRRRTAAASSPDASSEWSWRSPGPSIQEEYRRPPNWKGTRPAARAAARENGDGGGGDGGDVRGGGGWTRAGGGSGRRTGRRSRPRGERRRIAAGWRRWMRRGGRAQGGWMPGRCGEYPHRPSSSGAGGSMRPVDAGTEEDGCWETGGTFGSARAENETDWERHRRRGGGGGKQLGRIQDGGGRGERRPKARAGLFRARGRAALEGHDTGGG